MRVWERAREERAYRRPVAARCAPPARHVTLPPVQSDSQRLKGFQPVASTRRSQRCAARRQRVTADPHPAAARAARTTRTRARAQHGRERGDDAVPRAAEDVHRDERQAEAGAPFAAPPRARSWPRSRPLSHPSLATGVDHQFVFACASAADARARRVRRWRCKGAPATTSGSAACSRWRSWSRCPTLATRTRASAERACPRPACERARGAARIDRRGFARAASCTSPSRRSSRSCATRSPTATRSWRS